MTGGGKVISEATPVVQTSRDESLNADTVRGMERDTSGAGPRDPRHGEECEGAEEGDSLVGSLGTQEGQDLIYPKRKQE